MRPVRQEQGHKRRDIYILRNKEAVFILQVLVYMLGALYRSLKHHNDKRHDRHLRRRKRTVKEYTYRRTRKGYEDISCSGGSPAVIVYGACERAYPCAQSHDGYDKAAVVVRERKAVAEHFQHRRREHCRRQKDRAQDIEHLAGRGKLQLFLCDDVYDKEQHRKADKHRSTSERGQHPPCRPCEHKSRKADEQCAQCKYYVYGRGRLFLCLRFTVRIPIFGRPNIGDRSALLTAHSAVCIYGRRSLSLRCRVYRPCGLYRSDRSGDL